MNRYFTYFALLAVGLGIGVVVADATPAPPADTPADRTAELQRLIDAGGTLPAGEYRFAGQLLIRWNSLVGSGPQQTRLIYTGPPREDGAIKIAGGNWGYELRGFDLANSNPDAFKRGVGISAGRDGPAGGTQSGGAVWSRVTLYGFDTGVALGEEPGGATSEIVFQNVQFGSCRVGVTASQWNTLNLLFLMPGFVHCDAGILSIQAGSVNVIGGTATQVKGTLFRFRAGGTFSVKGFRAEGCGRFLDTGATTATTSVAVENCLVTAPRNEDGIDLHASWGAALAVRDSILAGKVVYNPTDETGRAAGYGSVLLENVRTLGDVLLDSRVGSRLRFDVRNCAILDDGYQVVKRLDLSREVFSGPVR